MTAARPISACCLIVACITAALQAQDTANAGGVYRVNARVAVVDAQVLDKKTGRAVRELKRDDFQVYEDDVRQQISSFSQDELPLSVVLLFDLTDSVRPVLKSLAGGALESLNHLKPQDEVAVMTYAASAQVVQDFTTDRGLAARAIEKAGRMESGEAAFFNEGIFQATAQLMRSHNPASRRVIIWLTDDIPNFPSDEIRARYGRSLGKAKLHTEKEAMEQLWRSGTMVSTLLLRSRMSDEEFSYRLSKGLETQIARMQYPPGDVFSYAAATGGQVMQLTGKQAQQRLAELIDDIRLRYILAYHPSPGKPAGRFCTIKVKLAPEVSKQKNLVVEAKQGYYR
ncbi:MAG TPA: VWA domain-containing protein [Candidatus Angelobacter sp.]